MAVVRTVLRIAVLLHLGVFGLARLLPAKQKLSLLSSRRWAWTTEDHLDGALMFQQLSRETPSDLETAPVRELIVKEMVQKYANKPPEDTWQERFEKAMMTPEDPCDADILSTFGWNAGFGSGMNILMAEVATAVYFGRTVAICYAPDEDPYSFDDIFDWEHPIRFCEQPERCPDMRQYAWDEGSKRTPWGFSAIFWAGCLNSMECDLNPTTKSPWLTPAQRHPGIDPEWREWSKRFRHFIYDSVYRIEEGQQKLIDYWVGNFGIESGRKYVGVHLRGTDKFQEAREVSVPEFAEKVHLALNRTNLRLVYMASDDWDFQTALKAHLKATIPGIVVVHKTKDEFRDGIDRRGGHNLDERHRMTLMGELAVLRNATAFVGTASSNIGRLLYFLRTPQVNDTFDISVDEGGDWLSRHC